MAIHGAIKLLHQKRYLSSRKDGRSVVLYDHKHPKQEFPEHILIPGDALEEIYQNSDLIFQSVYYEEYPVDTFQLSARILAGEHSVAIITMRRSIVLLNDLGVAESVKEPSSFLPLAGAQK